MPCLAQEHHHHHPKLLAAGHYCKSLSSLVRETYAHCHLPCVRIPGADGWSSGQDSDDSCLDEALDTKQVIINEMRSRQVKKRSRCSVDSPTTPSRAFAARSSHTPLDPRSVPEKVPVRNAVEEKEDEAADDGDADDESDAFFSVKSFFTRSTSRAATVASSVASMEAPPPLLRSPEAWEGFRGCEGWPFGLCRRPTVLALPPLPSSPSDPWKWRKSAGGLAASPLPAYSFKAAST